MKYYTIVALVHALLTLSVAAGQSIHTQVKQLIQNNNLGTTSYAALLLDLQTHRPLAEINADEPMIPASNMKLITTAAALQMLGNDFKFKTELRLVTAGDWGDPQDAASGVSLVIKGDGDPALGDPEVLKQHDLDIEQLFDKWVDAIGATGLKHIDRILIDDRIFDRQFVQESWPKDQLRYHYCAQVAGLNFHNNLLFVWPIPTKPGQSPRVILVPEAPFIATSNQAVTADSETFWVDRKLGSNQLFFWGKLQHPRRQPTQVTIHDPPMFFGKLLQQRLTKSGLQVDTIQRVDPSAHLPEGQLLFTVETTLFEVLRRCNSGSKNLYAEALFKRLGQRFTGAPGSWSNGAAAVRQFLQQRLGTVAAMIGVADGSGLSRDNRVTARVLVQLLRSMHEDEQLGLDFRQSLAVAGVRGTLEKRFPPRFKGRVFAKTGYISNVSALSGYVLVPASKSNRDEPHLVAFSMLFNDVNHPIAIGDIKKLQEKIIGAADDAYARLATAG